MTPIRERLLAMVAARLEEQIPDVPVERARRALVEIREMPRLIVRGGTLAPNDATAFGETLYSAEAIIEGYVVSTDPDVENPDLACERLLSELHARVVSALADWTPDGDDLNEVMESGTAEFLPYDLDESSEPAGEFVARFEAQSIRPTGHPYAAA
jgi:hypothetical protein